MAKTTKQPIATSKPLKTVKIIKKESSKELEEPKKSTVKKGSTKEVEKPKKSTVKKEPTIEVEKPIKSTVKKIKEIPVVESKKSVVNVAANLTVDSSDEKAELTIEKKLITLYNLQQIDSQIDKIRIIRGELPLEVQDLEDEIAGLETRVDNYIQETVVLEKFVLEKKNAIKDSQLLIKKYEDQQMNVRNNREYDSLTKEIEFQNLEIQLSEKRIREYQQSLDAKKLEIERFQNILQDRKNDLEIKNNELEDIVAETEKEENDLILKSEENRSYIEDRLITAYSRIRKNARNGLAVVQIERDACGGCFNKIPPQHQLDIRMHKKIIVCEYCGRILVDEGIVNVVG
jgi:predicted  nucleic acid-binding Zn-ribbon protein